MVGTVVIDTPLQHWDYWTVHETVQGRKISFLKLLYIKAHGLFQYSKHCLHKFIYGFK